MNPRNRWLLASPIAAALIGAGAMLWEGSKPKPYRDIAGIVTVCEGHTGRDIDENRIYTKAECDAFRSDDIRKHGEAVLRCVQVPLNDKTYAAFVLFTFNVGASAFCSSTLLEKLNAGDYVGGCNGMLAWDMATINKKKVRVYGLTRRRHYEVSLCLSGLA